MTGIMLVLGIESSCDEMAVSVVRDGIEILSNVIASQTAEHEDLGGVYPEMAARQHVELLIPTLEKALKEAGIGVKELDLIAVAKGPGLIGPLSIGLTCAKTLSIAWGIPFVGVDHVKSHLYSAMMSNNFYTFPSLGVVVSGGHTFIAYLRDFDQMDLIGTTVDDAIGEAFDKVATLLGLPYPGGPHIEELARAGDPNRYCYKPGKVKGKPWHFSFSGLKTNVLYTVKGQNGDKRAESVISEGEMVDVAASFQATALGDIAEKVLRAAKEFDCKAIFFGGGVSCNQKLRDLMEHSEVPVYFPSKELCTDNAAMIAGYGAKLAENGGDSLDLFAEPRNSIRQLAGQGL